MNCIPDWTNAPSGAKWHTIDPDGMGVWWMGESEPVVVGIRWSLSYPDMGFGSDEKHEISRWFTLSLGEDWRLTLNSKPEK